MVLMLSPMFTQAHYDERHPKNFQKEQVFHRSDFLGCPIDHRLCVLQACTLTRREYTCGNG